VWSVARGSRDTAASAGSVAAREVWEGWGWCGVPSVMSVVDSGVWVGVVAAEGGREGGIEDGREDLWCREARGVGVVGGARDVTASAGFCCVAVRLQLVALGAERETWHVWRVAWCSSGGAAVLSRQRV